MCHFAYVPLVLSSIIFHFLFRKLLRIFLNTYRLFVILDYDTVESRINANISLLQKKSTSSEIIVTLIIITFERILKELGASNKNLLTYNFINNRM